MSYIDSQVRELREIAEMYEGMDGGELLKECADTIESLYKKLKEKSNGGWIPCSERLPEEKTNPITNDFYEYQVTFQSEDMADIRHYKFGRRHWWNGPGIMDEYVTAWREPLEAYQEPTGKEIIG